MGSRLFHELLQGTKGTIPEAAQEQLKTPSTTARDTRNNANDRHRHEQLQLHGGTNYTMTRVNHPDVIGTGIFNDINSDGLVGEGDDLIAVIANKDQPVEIQRENLKFV